MCLRAIPENKGVDHTEREAAICGIIGTNRGLIGRKVVLLINVLTSGAMVWDRAQVLR
jgi:hypothetical protein